MGKQKVKMDSEMIRILSYLDSEMYPEAGCSIKVTYDDQMKANVYKAYNCNHIDTSNLKVEPFSVELGGYGLRVQQVDKTFIVDMHITMKSQGRFIINFGDVLLLDWNEREIVESDNFLASNLSKSVEEFIPLPILNEIVVYSILALNMGISKNEKTADEDKTVKRENFNIETNVEEKKESAESKEPEYVTASWKVASYKRKDGTHVSGYESNRDPNLLNKKVGNQ